MGLLFLFFTLSSHASVSIIDAQGWLETAWVKWQLPQGNSELRYNVYVSEADKDSWTKLDDQLVRNYGTYGRADAIGLKAGSYQLKVVQLIDGNESAKETAVSSSLEVRAHDRTGFAHMNRDTEGIYEGVGAYRNDGTLKDNALVLYVTANNAKTITQKFQYYASGKDDLYKSYTGIGRIIEGYRKCWAQGNSKGFTLPPLVVRIIGLLKNGDMDYLSGAGLQIKGENKATELPITIEGVGSDATISGFGFAISQVTGVEIRNLGIMLYNEDGISVTSNGKHLWLHNNDIFYGSTGKDASILTVGSPTEARVLFVKLASQDTWIAEELIQQHPAMAEWNPSSVNTLRVPTIATENGIKILQPFLRTGRKQKRARCPRSASRYCGG